MPDKITINHAQCSTPAGIEQLLNAMYTEIAQARTLFDQVYYLRKRVARLASERVALAPLQTAITRALHAGDLTYEVAGAGLSAAADAATQLGDAQRQLHLAEHDLHTLLGLDALYIANEGKFIAIVAPEVAEAALAALRSHPLGQDAARIGVVQADEHQFVQMKTALGGMRVVDWLAGEPLPRIC